MQVRQATLLLTLLLLSPVVLAGCLTSPGEVTPTGEEGAPASPDEGAREGEGEGDPGDEGARRNGSSPPNGSDEAPPDGSEVDEPTSERYEPGWPAIDDAVVRPGVSIVDGTCTANFVFMSPDNRTLYIGTAAHCVDEHEIGDDVRVAGGQVMGTLVYASWRTMEARNESSSSARAYNDLALVELPDDARHLVHPAILHYGGPVAIADETPGFQDKVLVYGNSALREGTTDDLDPHEGYVTTTSTWHTSFYLVTPGVPGDSGSPVVTEDGRALGVLIHLEFAPEPGSNDALNLGRALAYMEETEGIHVDLATWELLDDGQL